MISFMRFIRDFSSAFRIPGLILTIFFLLHLSTLRAQKESDTTLPQKILHNTQFSGQWFLSYRVFDQDNDDYNAFTLKRGYLTFTKEFNKTLSIRFTQDITLDEEGSDAGNIEMRLKYCYLRINTYRIPYMEHGYVEAGLVHRPWLDFEEKINRYRVQGMMFLERHCIMNSADFGLTYVNLLGGKLNKDYRPGSLSSFPGKYGSVSLGVYNGGGYHAIEYNDNKTFEGRISLRPFPFTIPGLQLSYHMVRGKGNTAKSPEFFLDHGFISFENRFLSLTAQHFKGKGNSSGNLVDEQDNAIRTNGSSFFAEVLHPRTGIALFSRHDYYHCVDNCSSDISSIVGGVAYYFLKDSKVIIDFDRQRTNDGKRWIYEIAVELKF